MTCPQCQASNEDTATFCRNCGTRLAQPAAGSGPAGSASQSTVRANPAQQAPGSGGPAQPGYQDQQAPPGYQAPPGPADYPAPPGAAGYPPAAGYQGAPATGYSAPPGTPGYQNAPARHSPGQPFRFDLRRLSRVDQVVGGASLVVFITIFLPWFGISILGQSFTEDGTTAHGYLVIVLILALVLIAYLLLRSGWDEFPVSLPIAHAPLLLIGTGLQFLLVLIGFLDKPAELDWEFGAYLCLIASLIATAPLVVPAVRSWQGSR